MFEGVINEAEWAGVNYKYYNMFGCIAPPLPPQSPVIPGYYIPIVIALVMVSTISLIRKQKYKLK